MSERPHPVETQKPPMVLAVEQTREFFEKVENSEPFKKAYKAVLSKLGSITPESREAATNMVKSGAGMAMNIVGLLPAFANPEKRKEILEEFEKTKTEGAWVNVLANWNTGADPSGTGVLAQCKKASISEILEKQHGVEDEKQKEQIKIHAEAISKGQDIIISYYKQKLSSAKSAQAA